MRDHERRVRQRYTKQPQRRRRRHQSRKQQNTIAFKKCSVPFIGDDFAYTALRRVFERNRKSIRTRTTHMLVLSIWLRAMRHEEFNEKIS